MFHHSTDSVVYPVFGIGQRNTGKGNGNRRGFSYAIGVPNTMVRYAFNEKVALKLDLEIETRFYQLADDSHFLPEGFIKCKEIVPGLQVEYAPVKELIMRMGMRHVFESEITYFDKDENELATDEIDGARSYLVSLDFIF